MCAALLEDRDALPANLGSEEIEAHLYWIARKRNNSTITTSA